jgi:hypothetical protein
MALLVKLVLLAHKVHKVILALLVLLVLKVHKVILAQPVPLALLELMVLTVGIIMVMV